MVFVTQKELFGAVGINLTLGQNGITQALEATWLSADRVGMLRTR